MLLAITHVPSEHLERCELTHVARSAIDYTLAIRQHEQYRRTLAQCGASVVTLTENVAMADCAFVEDTAIVLDEVAVIASMGAASRREETRALEFQLRQYREVRRIQLPGTIEGGDVLACDRTLFVGQSSRTNPAGIRAFAGIVERFGYQVVPVSVTGCLHLKSACTALDDSTLLINPQWVDTSMLAEFRRIEVPAGEPFAANVARIGEHLCTSSAHARTANMLCDKGYHLHTVDISEFAKAEAGTTCLSILFQA